MKSFKFFLVLLIIAFSFQGFSQTADEVVGNYVKAIGGLDKISSLKTIRMTAKVSGGGMEMPIIMTFKRPNMMMNEITLQGMVMKQGYDGKQGWYINPFGGKKDPEVLPDDQGKMFQKQSDFEGGLVNYKEKGSKVELIGKEDLEGSEVYNLKLTDKDGNITTYYLDASSYMVLKEKNKFKLQDKEVESEMIYSNYQPVEGVLVPFAYDVKVPNNPMGDQKMIIEKIEANIPVEDSFFKMPETK